MRITWLLATALSLAVVGCESGGGNDDAGRGGADARADFDAAPSDGGTGPTDAQVDAPPAVDARTCSDGGPTGGDCVLYVPRGSFGPLLGACLPRCTAASAAAYRACTTASCRNAAVAGDTTPGVEYYIGTVRVTSPLDCGGCVAYQEMHCYSEVCPAEVDSYVDECIAGGTASSCDFALAQLDACLASLTPAEEGEVDACFASPQGPEGCFPCP